MTTVFLGHAKPEKNEHEKHETTRRIRIGVDVSKRYHDKNNGGAKGIQLFVVVIIFRVFRIVRVRHNISCFSAISCSFFIVMHIIRLAPPSSCTTDNEQETVALGSAASLVEGTTDTKPNDLYALPFQKNN